MRKYIISHDNKYLQVWNIVYGIVALSSVWFGAINLAFRGIALQRSSMRNINILNDLILMVGIVVKFFISYEQPASVRMQE